MDWLHNANRFLVSRYTRLIFWFCKVLSCSWTLHVHQPIFPASVQQRSTKQHREDCHMRQIPEKCRFAALTLSASLLLLHNISLFLSKLADHLVIPNMHLWYSVVVTCAYISHERVVVVQSSAWRKRKMPAALAESKTLSSACLFNSFVVENGLLHREMQVMRRQWPDFLKCRLSAVQRDARVSVLLAHRHHSRSDNAIMHRLRRDRIAGLVKWLSLRNQCLLYSIEFQFNREQCRDFSVSVTV